jgi:hypothetical protein
LVGTRWRNTLAVVVAATVLAAAFPRLAHWARWPTRLAPRGRLLYIAYNAAFYYAVRELARHVREDHEQAVEELRAELGREPTDDELRAHRFRKILRDQLGREPTAEELRRVLGVTRRY